MGFPSTRAAFLQGLEMPSYKARSPDKRKAIVAKICRELSVHALLEGEIFYPAFKAAVKDHELVPEALVEHESVKNLIALAEGLAARWRPVNRSSWRSVRDAG